MYFKLLFSHSNMYTVQVNIFPDAPEIRVFFSRKMNEASFFIDNTPPASVVWRYKILMD
jgi:hypothetical protein